MDPCSVVGLIGADVLTIVALSVIISAFAQW